MVKPLAPFFLIALVAAAAFASCSDRDDVGRTPFGSPRGIALSPASDALLIADAGTGDDDGRILSVPLPSIISAGPLDASSIEVIMDGLPSTSVEDRGYTAVAGPAAVAMAEDGVVCAVISSAGDQPGELRCTGGLEVDLSAFEAERNPGGGSMTSDPAGIAPDALRGWFVSDAAGHSVLFIDREGTLTVVAVFVDIDGMTEDGAPTGLYAIQGDVGPLVAAALYGGALAGFSPALDQPPLVQTIEGRPVAILDDGSQTIGLIRSNADGGARSGSLYSLTTGETLVAGLDRPSGLAALPGGRFAISFEDTGAIEVVTP